MDSEEAEGKDREGKRWFQIDITYDSLCKVVVKGGGGQDYKGSRKNEGRKERRRSEAMKNEGGKATGKETSTQEGKKVLTKYPRDLSVFVNEGEGIGDVP
jgi:hypothetical protein